jgi:hypothetical protein
MFSSASELAGKLRAARYIIDPVTLEVVYKTDESLARKHKQVLTIVCQHDVSIWSN